MLTVTFEPIYDGQLLIGKRLTIFYNKKIVSTKDFPARVEMTADELDAYVAGKLEALFT
jgi:hypothetical protein